jgi:hypothetical protein
MRSRNGGILDLINDFRVLRFRRKRNVLRLHLDRLIEILLVECVILLVVFAISHRESVVPGAVVQLCIFLAASTREPRSGTN